MCFFGTRIPTDSIALKKASSRSCPMQPTSPVEDISTPSTGSVRVEPREAELGGLDADPFEVQRRGRGFSPSASRMALVAS